MKLIWSSAFKRAYKKVIKKNPKLKDKIANVLKKLEIDPFHPSLKTHKLSGNLADFWSCSVAYDCRIIFELSENAQVLEVFILLIDIGSHDEVY
jgi:mRNA interferase YafQ